MKRFQLDGVLTLVREGDTITIEYEDKFLKKINGESVEKRKTYTMRYDIKSIFHLRHTDSFYCSMPSPQNSRAIIL
jgi:dihydroxyacid dehydratase/phosphogluconate dehydratase